jgi:hypothetical protein
MTKLLSIIADGFVSLVAVLFPMFLQARSGAAEATNPVGRWLVRGVLAAIGFWVLWLLNNSELIGLKYVTGKLGEYWLPLFVLCLYIMIWLGWSLYRLLTMQVPTVGSPFPDIDAAWDQAVEALTRAEISLLETPLFLILGRNKAGDEALFKASRLRLAVEPFPGGPGDPLRVSANRDGIWVTCAGASLLAQYVPVSTGGEGRVPSASETLTGLGDDFEDAEKTIGGGSGLKTMRITQLFSNLNVAEIMRKGRRAAARKAIDPELYKARLRYLCELIKRDREGLCPVNGMLVLLPSGLTEPKADVPQLAEACQADLKVALDSFRVRCPIRFLVCDLETLDGFESVVERLPSELIPRRVGQSFPLAPDLSLAEVPAKIHSSVLFVTEHLLPTMIYSRFAVESPGGEDLASALGANADLVRFLSGLRDRQDRLARLVRDGIPPMGGEPPFFGGCYFAGIGEAGASTFVPGVFTSLVRDQDLVTWTKDFLEEDAANFRLAGYLRTFLIVLIGLASLFAIAMFVSLQLSKASGG